MSTSLTNVSIKIAGLGVLIVYGASGSCGDSPVVTCSGGTVVDGQDPPELQGNYDIQSDQGDFNDVTCIAVDSQSWTFETQQDTDAD